MIKMSKMMIRTSSMKRRMMVSQYQSYSSCMLLRQYHNVRVLDHHYHHHRQWKNSLSLNHYRSMMECRRLFQSTSRNSTGFSTGIPKQGKQKIKSKKKRPFGAVRKKNQNFMRKYKSSKWIQQKTLESTSSEGGVLPFHVEVSNLPSHLNTEEKIATAMGDQVQSFRQSIRSLFVMEDTVSTTKRRRVGPVMDANWWFWNILLALSPAFILVLVCEYHQEEMENYFRQQNERDKSRILGLDNNHDNDIQQDFMTSISSSVTFKDRVMNAIQDFTQYYSTQQQQQQQHESQKEKKNNDSTIQKNDVKEELVSKNGMDPLLSTQTNENDNNDNIDVSELLRRIQILEQQVSENNRTQKKNKKKSK